ncbi:MAG: aminotransferase class I/II-fold pyridoxal phosphate-dependent enzyme [Chitinophagales bacterium]
MLNPDKNDRIYLSPPHLSGNELACVQDALNSNWVAPIGPALDGFERLICEQTSASYCVALQSGTAALHIALLILGVKRDDIVIISDFTFPASANPVIYTGAVPVFVDIETETWNINPELLEYAIKDCLKNGKKPKAIIVPHIYGMPAKMQEIMSVANAHDIPVIEDAAEALGSTYNGRHVGLFGAIGVLSFNGNKIITTSGGGALISNNPEYIVRAKFLATQARDKMPYYEHSEIGYNYRLSNICAAIGIGQMTVLKGRIQQRRRNFEKYKTKLADIDEISFLEEPEGHFSNRWLTTILVNPTPLNRLTHDEIRLRLEEDNIESRPLWKPLHLQPVFKQYLSYSSGNAEKLFISGLCLPSGSALTTAEFERIIPWIRQK